MKKIIISIALIGILMISGCTSSKETSKKEEDTTLVYCNDCGNESNEVTKFCSECGEEAKWVAEKQDSKEDDKSISKEVEEEKKDTKGQCYFCLKYVPKDNLVKLKGLSLCSQCNSVDEKTCDNGFEDLCEGCIDCNGNNFTGEEALRIAEAYYGVEEDDDDSFISVDSEPSYDSGGMYYKMWAKSMQMINEGGNGIIFAFKTYEDGTIVEY